MAGRCVGDLLEERLESASLGALQTGRAGAETLRGSMRGSLASFAPRSGGPAGPSDGFDGRLPVGGVFEACRGGSAGFAGGSSR
mmetsp:Transcript_53570/g.152846  ORF Transcript_53570/g.152846 Transcript_53570/m.152846 type:complete len:84 (+) Transcript_53570:1195-1446(+)